MGTINHLTGRALRLSALLMLWASADPAFAQQPVFPRLDADAPAGTGRMAPCLEEIEGEVLCGRFRVPENRDRPGERSIDLGFVVLKALEDRGLTDAVTLLNGGPGVPTTPAAPFVATPLRETRRHRDILLIDHRGTGASQAIPCDNPFPGGVASRFGTVFPLDHVEACIEILSERTDLTQYTTPRAMDDLAEVVRWLDYTGLNIQGGSYGSREAMIFARRHPELTRTVVLNGVAPSHRPGYIHHARYLHEALHNLAEECTALPACRDRYGDVEETADEVFRLIRASPPELVVEGERVTFHPGDLSYALRGLLYGASGTVPARLEEASRGDWQALAEFYLQRQAWVGGATGVPAGYHFSVLCAEDVSRVTERDIRRETAGTFMGDHLIGGYSGVCERWPHAQLPESYFEPVRSRVPTLILSGARDPVTPPENGRIMAELWPNSLHVVVPNGGHGQGGPCVGGMVATLLETASVRTIDTSCVQAAPPTQFEFEGG